MPTITKVHCSPTPASLDHPIALDVAINLITPGPVTVYVALEEPHPYCFIAGGKQVREILFTRMFPSAGDHVAQFIFSLTSLAPDGNDPSLVVRAAGFDGSSLPVRMVIDML